VLCRSSKFITNQIKKGVRGCMQRRIAVLLLAQVTKREQGYHTVGLQT